ncbi:uncharacterized protein BX664DRAFT_343689 [Halteromyces radiatus]|uniref:uncharacterized protein n=1 Tax=Halteromyces radiatus TaxID=101107 RepID=UPI00222053FF|nr:uncharacterized protein BX664DRAFT_343689 [Halteromyces radiatus]KAI8077859.1 hypothetical protein BX664DRAFT_343689 [Halteromyces radiatus]
MSFFRRISRRLHTHPNRRFGRQRTSSPNNVTSVAPSMTSSVRRATVAATHAAAAATGPLPPLPFLHIDPHPSNSSAASTTSAISNASDISQIISEIISTAVLSSIPSAHGDINNNNNNNNSSNGIFVHDSTSFFRYMQMPIRSQQHHHNHHHQQDRSSSTDEQWSTNGASPQTVLPIFIVGYRTNAVDSSSPPTTATTTTTTTNSNTPTTPTSNGTTTSTAPPPMPTIPTYLPTGPRLRRPHSAISTSSSLATLQSMPISIQSNRTNHTSQTALHAQQNQHHPSTTSLPQQQQQQQQQQQSQPQQQRESLASSSASSTRSSSSSSTGSGRWLIYVLSGQHHHYPSPTSSNNSTSTHPLLQHPALARLSDNPTYEDLLWLSSVLGSARPVTTTQHAIDATLPIHLWSDETTKRTMLQDTERCLVCLDDFTPKQSVRVLKCRHVFHVECVDRWLVEAHNSCPVCRGVPVTTPASPPVA